MAFGLYFDNEEITLAVTKKSRKGAELVVSHQTLMGDATLKEGIGISDLGGEVSPELKIVANLQKAIREAKVETKDVVFSLPTRELTVRSFKMPKIPKKEWDETVRFEAKKYIPFLIEDVVSAFFVKKPTFKDKDMDVLFIACPKKTVNKYLSLLKEADLKVVSLEAEVFSIFRALQFKLKKEKSVRIAILKWHRNAGFILVLEKDMPQLVRDFSIPMIQNYKSEQIPQKLVNELRVSFTYYQRQFGKESVDKIYLCVDEQSSGWDEIISKNLGIEVNLVYPFSVIENSSSFPNNTASLHTALGASLKGLVRTPLEINLAEEKKLFKYRYEMSLPVKILIASALILMAGFYALFNQKIVKEKHRLESIIAQRPKTNISVSYGIDQLKNMASNKQDRLETLKNLIDKRQYLTFKVEALAKALPDGVWIDDLSFREDVAPDGSVTSHVNIKGYAFLQDKEAEISSVNKFVSNLKLETNFSTNFKHVELSYIKQVAIEGYDVTSFELVCSP